jgi:flagellar biosynthesis/type III secretory pathway protein FliH
MMNELEPALKKAMSVLEFLSQDEQARQHYEARQKFLRDEASMIEGAREEGLKEGLEEGIQKGIDSSPSCISFLSLRPHCQFAVAFFCFYVMFSLTYLQ